MKRIYAALTIVALGLSVGCHAQVPSNPTVWTCPLATTGTWTALETPANEVTGLSVKDTTAPIGVWCYAATSIINTASPIVQSVASNVVQATTTSVDPVADLSWTVPASGPTPTGYILYRIAAIQSTILAPTQNPATISVSALVKPALPGSVAAPVLTAKVVRSALGK